jgi:hypothetical protein
MIDASDETYQAVYVTIKDVAVSQGTGSGDGEAEWQTVATLNQTYNLLTLVNGVTAALGSAQLEAGTYNQLRLILGTEADDSLNIQNNAHPFPQYLIDSEGNVHEMKVPSGYQSGIKLVSQFEIEDSERTELILDFDVTRSIHLAGKIGNNGKYILRPTIKVIGTYNRAVVSGLVFAEAYLQGATVTAWPAGDDSSLSAISTTTNEFGAYTLYLGLGEEPNLPQDYTLVAHMNGYTPECVHPFTVAADQTYTQDFILSALPDTDMVTVTGTVTGDFATLPAQTPSIHISFQQDGCGIPVEIAYTDTTDDDDTSTTEIFYDSTTGAFQYKYEITIPSGDYDVVASTEGLTSVERSFNTATDSAPLDFSF